MREIIIPSAHAGRRLDKYLRSEYPLLTVGVLQRFFRLKRIRLNGKVAHAEDHIEAGAAVQLYIEDTWFEKPKKEDPFLSRIHPKLTIVYEDAHILLVDKRPGLLCHPDDKEKVHTLINEVRAYLYQKGAYDPSDAKSFSPVLCNRIDRFTGGIVIIAKTFEAQKILNAAIREREIRKFYLCLVEGRVRAPRGRLDNYIFKNTKRVTVLDAPKEGAQRATTDYRVLGTYGKTTLLECELLTGRTHQIRAQFSHAGHPLLGDGQYSAQQGRRDYQALYAYKIEFALKNPGVLAELNGRSFCVKQVPFDPRNDEKKA